MYKWAASRHKNRHDHLLFIRRVVSSRLGLVSSGAELLIQKSVRERITIILYLDKIAIIILPQAAKPAHVPPSMGCPLPLLGEDQIISTIDSPRWAQPLDIRRPPLDGHHPSV